MKTKNKIIQQYYNVGRPVTDQEVQLEIKSLLKKDKKGSLDNLGDALFIALQLDKETTQ